MDGVEGFEPPFTVSETGVLPLDDTPKWEVCYHLRLTGDLPYSTSSVTPCLLVKERARKSSVDLGGFEPPPHGLRAQHANHYAIDPSLPELLLPVGVGGFEPPTRSLKGMHDNRFTTPPYEPTDTSLHHPVCQTGPASSLEERLPSAACLTFR